MYIISVAAKRQIVGFNELSFPLDFGLFAFGISIEKGGFRRAHADSIPKPQQSKAITVAERPSSRTIDDLLPPNDISTLEKKAFFVKNVGLQAPSFLYYSAFPNRVPHIIIPMYLVNSTFQIPSVTYVGYASHQDGNFYYDREQAYKPLNEIKDYQQAFQPAEPYFYPLIKPDDISIAKIYTDTNFAPGYDMPRQAIQALNDKFWMTGPSFIGIYRPVQSRSYNTQREASHTLENLVAKPPIKFHHMIQPQQFLPQFLTQKSYKIGVDRLVDSLLVQQDSSQATPKYRIFTIGNTGMQRQYQQDPDISNIIMIASSPDAQYNATGYNGNANSGNQNSGQKNKANEGNPSKPTQNSQDSKNSDVIYFNEYRHPRRRTTQEWKPRRSHGNYKPEVQGKKIIAGKARHYLRFKTTNRESDSITHQAKGQNQRHTPKQNIVTDVNNTQEQSTGKSNPIQNLVNLDDYRNQNQLNSVLPDARIILPHESYRPFSYIPSKKLINFVSKGTNNLFSFVTNAYSKLKNQPFFGDVYARLKNHYSKVSLDLTGNPNLPKASSIGIPNISEEVSKLQDIAQYLEKESGGVVACVIIDVKTGEILASRNEDKPYSNGSLFKIFIIKQVLELSQQGKINLEDELKLRDSLKPKNCTDIKGPITVREAIREVDTDEHGNSNWYTNALMEQIGLKRSNKILQQQGYTKTVIVDYCKPGALYRDDKTSANDTARAMREITVGRRLDDKHHKIGLRTMNWKRMNYLLNSDGIYPESILGKHGQTERDISVAYRMKGIKDGKEFDGIVVFGLSNISKPIVNGDFKTGNFFGVRIMNYFIKASRQVSEIAQSLLYSYSSQNQKPA